MFSSLLSLILVCSVAFPAQDGLAARVATAREMIKQQRYNDALNILEQVVEQNPSHAEAVSLLAMSQMYTTGDFVKSLARFEDAFKIGGCAVFWVSHSHEKLGTSELADYCRGWLYIRKDGVEFTPQNGDHGFQTTYSQIEELAQNKLAKRLFHIKYSNKTYNFRPRSGEESEVLLVIALYKRHSK